MDINTIRNAAAEVATARALLEAAQADMVRAFRQHYRERFGLDVGVIVEVTETRNVCRDSTWGLGRVPTGETKVRTWRGQVERVLTSSSESSVAWANDLPTIRVTRFRQDGTAGAQVDVSKGYRVVATTEEIATEQAQREKAYRVRILDGIKREDERKAQIARAFAVVDKADAQAGKEAAQG